MFGQGRVLPWTGSPVDVLRRWDEARPVALLHSGRYHARWSRGSILAEPLGTVVTGGDATRWVGPLPAGRCEPLWSGDPIRDLEVATQLSPEALWVGYFGYDTARWIEALPTLAADDRDWPIAAFHCCPGFAAHDLATDTWTAHGTWAACPPDLSAQAADSVFKAGAAKPAVPREAYMQEVQRCIDYIAAGDIFQVNLTQRFTAGFSGSPRALYESLAHHSPAWYGAYVELPAEPEGRRHLALASTSPELFVEVDSDGAVVTRPIKGTRPVTRGLSDDEVDPAREALRYAPKDTAELNMIVDLLRNDLGRVCRLGSVRVVAPREIESHPTVHHGVATIEGRLATGSTLYDLLRAALPGGSITGAPKVRAMEIIESLEPARRGPYCGAIGYVYQGHACFNIAIRTLQIDTATPHAACEGMPGRVDFSVGGAVVADSSPQGEYEETLHKAAAMVRALRGLQGR